jgi:mannose-1-phosphate guanylyltransferase/mannose-6-phosphate isomerase
MSDARIIPVVLSGGSGTRLWPVSREKHPKQLAAPAGRSESLLQNTLRASKACRWRADRRQQPGISLHHRGTTARTRTAGLVPAAGAGRPQYGPGADGRRALRRSGMAPIRCCWPRRRITMCANAGAFRAAVLRGWPEAERGAVVTFGIVPDRPETGYGYIETKSGAGDPRAAYPGRPAGLSRKARCRDGRGLCGRRQALLEQRNLHAARVGLAQGHRPFGAGDPGRLPRR